MTGRAILMALPSRIPHPDHNQQAITLVREELTGGLHGGYIFNRGKLVFYGIFGHALVLHLLVAKAAVSLILRLLMAKAAATHIG